MMMEQWIWSMGQGLALAVPKVLSLLVNAWCVKIVIREFFEQRSKHAERK